MTRTMQAFRSGSGVELTSKKIFHLTRKSKSRAFAI